MMQTFIKRRRNFLKRFGGIGTKLAVSTKNR
jgi:hypothetical protein